MPGPLSNIVADIDSEPQPEPEHGRSAHFEDAMDGSEDDDDMNYEPSTEDSPDDTAYYGLDDDEENEREFVDAAEELDMEIEFMVDASPGPGGTNDEAEQGPPEPPQARRYTTAQMLQLLGARGFQSLLQNYRARISGSVNDDDEEDDMILSNFRRRSRKKKNIEDCYPPVPNDNGKELMKSGKYGSQDTHTDIRRKRKDTLAKRLMWRRLGLDVRGSQTRSNRLIAQSMLPSLNTRTPQHIIHYDHRAYSGQFSDDGNFFFSCSQDFNVRMYDTSNPYNWKYYKRVHYPMGQWTITDATLSPNNKHLAYTSIKHLVALAPTDPSDDSEPRLLDLTNFVPGIRRGGQYGYTGHRSGFGIWSIRFSGDGRELVAGNTDHSVVVYDIERGQSVLNLQNHQDDVNAVCFGDSSSPHIIYSGSDDATIRVWDRRSMSDGREAGIFCGHKEGLTYVDSKGDGRYVLSNGKDQLMKLWDLRKMVSPNEFEQGHYSRYRGTFDYRFSAYEADVEYEPHPKDCSVVTFRGHSVLKTLIRCHFSPPGSTDSRYVYSGSEDGNVWIWDMDAQVKGKIDVAAATEGTRPRQRDVVSATWDVGGGREGPWKTCVRDASWHPHIPVLAATSWNGYGMSHGTCTLHTWNDGAEGDEAEPEMGVSYDARLNVKMQQRQCDQEGDGEAGARGGRRAGLRSRAVEQGNGAGGGAETGGGGRTRRGLW